MAARRTAPAGATKTKPAPQAPIAGRTSKGTFAKGCSGNPGGRRPDLAEVRELARTYANTAITTLVEIAERGKSEASRIAASVALLDRGYGRPASVLSDEDGNPIRQPGIVVIAVEERRAAAREAIAAAMAQHGAADHGIAPVVLTARVNHGAEPWSDAGTGEAAIPLPTDAE